MSAFTSSSLFQLICENRVNDIGWQNQINQSIDSLSSDQLNLPFSYSEDGRVIWSKTCCLQVACRLGQLETVESLLSKTPLIDVNLQSNTGSTSYFLLLKRDIQV